MKVILFEVSKLKHIEGFSPKRVKWLRDKILREQVWSVPLALDDKHGLVLDGQHRMEVALDLNLLRVPAIQFDYSSVPLRSLREKYNFDWKDVVENVLSNNLYPYKTVKHDFIEPLPKVNFNLEDLK
ncbi:MAG: hypothetical protein ACON33_07370 [Candidatus Micropelagos thuwalensis]